jgi:hypothetical protein
MLQPKRTKYRKQFKGRNERPRAGAASKVSFGEFGLKATSGRASPRARSRPRAARSAATSSVAARSGSACSPTSRSPRSRSKSAWAPARATSSTGSPRSSPARCSTRSRASTRTTRARGVPPGRRQALGHDLFRDPDGALMELKQGTRSKSAAELKAQLLELRKEQFSLRMQKATGQLDQDPPVQAACAARSRASRRCSAQSEEVR